MYVLHEKLQSQKAHNKWSDRSRVGIYLCESPRHASSVPLILNTQTGSVSPQFHCVYDDEFATCKRDANFTSQWQYKAKLALRNIPNDSIRRTLVLPTQITSERDGARASEEVPNLPPIMQTDWDERSSTSVGTLGNEADPQPDLDTATHSTETEGAPDPHIEEAGQPDSSETGLTEAATETVTTTRSGRKVRISPTTKHTRRSWRPSLHSIGKPRELKMTPPSPFYNPT